MEIRQLRYFLVLAEQRQFRRAARRLHVTTQALSMAMTALERAVGCELLVRGRGCRVVELTAAGAALREHAREIVDRADRAIAGLHAPAGRRPPAADRVTRDRVRGVRPGAGRRSSGPPASWPGS